MKTRHFLTIAGIALFGILSCTKTPDSEGGNKDEGLKTPELKSDMNSITVTGYTDQNAITFTWSAASEKNDVTYSFQYWLKNATSSQIIKCDNETSISFTFNEIEAIREKLKVEPETDFEFVAAVEAKSTSVALPVNSNTLQITVKYDLPEEKPLELYGIGDAFSWGWDRAKAEKLSTEDHITFTWTGWLESGNGKAFKFLTEEALTNESWLPSYGRNGESEENYWTLALCQTDSDPDVQFSVSQSGNYELVLNVSDMTISATYQGDGKVHLFGIGTGFDWKWDLASAQEFTTEDQNIFTWTGDGNAGGFKLMLSNTSWELGYNWDKEADGGVKPTGDETEWTMILREDSQDLGKEKDNYFAFAKAGNYTVTVNIETKKLTIKYNGLRSDYVPETNYDMDGLYLYGPANPNGPKLANEIALTLTDEKTRTYVYEGNLKASDGFKLMTLKGKWWPAFVWDVNDETQTTMLYSKGEIDKYWPIAEEGYYRVTAVVNSLKITIERLGDKK